MAMDKAGGAAGGGCGGVPGGIQLYLSHGGRAEKTVYASYTAQTGDIATTMSFNAQISAIHTETLQNSGEATVSNIYVTQDQAVKAGDKILDLSNGETLKAGIDGTVNEITVAKGDWLRRSQGLVQIVDFTQLQVDLSVDEYDVQKVYKGLPCTVTIISLGLDIETEIDHINLVSGSMGNVASYSATARLDAPANVLPGMAATVTIARRGGPGRYHPGNGGPVLPRRRHALCAHPPSGRQLSGA